MSRHIDKASIAAAAEALKDMQQEQESLSIKEVMYSLRPEIDAAIEKGYTFREIVERIQKILPLSASTIRYYYYRREPEPKRKAPHSSGRR